MDSAPGPDGIPYSCWRNLPRRLQAPLYRAYVKWMEGGSLPHDANLAFLVLIAKGAHADDSGNSLFRAAEQTRPLSLSNTDVKIFECALRSVLEEALATWANAKQRGFVRGRVMLQNVLEVESRSLALAFSQYCSRTRPAAILFDFGNDHRVLRWI